MHSAGNRTLSFLHWNWNVGTNVNSSSTRHVTDSNSSFINPRILISLPFCIFRSLQQFFILLNLDWLTIPVWILTPLLRFRKSRILILARVRPIWPSRLLRNVSFPVYSHNHTILYRVSHSLPNPAFL